MKEKHALRTNQLIFLVHLVTTIFGCIGLISQLTMAEGMTPIQSILPIILLLAGFIISTVLLLKDKSSEVYAKVVGCSFSVAYFFMMIMGATGATFPYMIPFLVVLMFTLDFSCITIPGAVFIVTNIIRIIITMAGAENKNDVIESCSVELIITILISIVVLRGLKVINAFFEESIEEVSGAAAHNEQVAGKIVEVAGEVAEYTASMSESLDVILDSTTAVNNSMADISDGMDSTADAIMNQTVQTQDIQEVIDDTHNRAEKIVDITKDAQSALDEGTKAINNLFEQVDVSINESAQMQIAATELEDKISKVHGITNIILGISNQTNLLALNASIEAARAGELGKGFAVVAGEIRNLAEQTRSETENITALINELAGNAKDVKKKVESSVESSNKENECAQLASAKFREITSKIADLSTEISEISTRIYDLRTSNNAIVDNVNTISAASQQITASTHEASTVSEKNMALLNEFADMVSDLKGAIETLKSYT